MNFSSTLKPQHAGLALFGLCSLLNLVHPFASGLSLWLFGFNVGLNGAFLVDGYLSRYVKQAPLRLRVESQGRVLIDEVVPSSVVRAGAIVVTIDPGPGFHIDRWPNGPPSVN